jgi:type I restriction enzyme R subunit
MDGNEELFQRLMSDADIRGIAVNDIAKSLNQRFRKNKIRGPS